MPTDHRAVIIGAGQAGLSVSYFLTKAGLPHVVLDKGPVAGAWAERWDSFCLVTPNWSINLAGQSYSGDDPDGFMSRDDFIAYMRRWAEGFGAPVRTGVRVDRIAARDNGFTLATGNGEVTAEAVVVATATHQAPKVPAVAERLPGQVTQLHAQAYRNPAQLPEGAVLVVGSGQTGCQIVEDLLRAGRKVFLCVGRTGRLPRRYRGRDCIDWQRDLRFLDRTPDMLESTAQRFASDPHVSGRDGGTTISLHDFNRRGVTLLGRLKNVVAGDLRFDETLADDVAFADAFAQRFYATVDDYIAGNNIDAPLPTPAELAGGAQKNDPPVEHVPALSIVDSGIASVVWATGFAFDFSWIDFPVTDDFGYPVTRGGATAVDGFYFCGLNYMTKRKSGILYGVAEDAEAVAEDLLRFLAHTPR